MKVEYAPAASKQFSRLNKPIQSRIKKYMSEIALLDNPRSRGKALTSNLSGLWRYRVGDYRIICDIQNNVLRILIVELGNRKEVYRR